MLFFHYYNYYYYYTIYIHTYRMTHCLSAIFLNVSLSIFNCNIKSFLPFFSIMKNIYRPLKKPDEHYSEATSITYVFVVRSD